MKNTKNNSNPTTMIKCRFSNEVHKILFPNYAVKASERWKLREKNKFTDVQKLEMFEQIMNLHNETSTELTNYQADRSKKRKVEKARIARGYVAKTKTKKEDYLKGLGNESLQNVAA